MSKRLLAAFAATLCGVGCSGQAERSATVQVVDSAGIRVVTNLTLEAPAWALTPEPVLDLGTVEGGGPDQFFRVSAARRLNDGAVAIFNA